MMYCQEIDVRRVTASFDNDIQWNNLTSEQINGLIEIASQHVLGRIVPSFRAMDLADFLADFGSYPSLIRRMTALQTVLLLSNQYSPMATDSDVTRDTISRDQIEQIATLIIRTGIFDPDGNLWRAAPNGASGGPLPTLVAPPRPLFGVWPSYIGWP